MKINKAIIFFPLLLALTKPTTLPTKTLLEEIAERKELLAQKIKERPDDKVLYEEYLDAWKYYHELLAKERPVTRPTTRPVTKYTPLPNFQSELDKVSAKRKLSHEKWAVALRCPHPIDFDGKRRCFTGDKHCALIDKLSKERIKDFVDYRELILRENLSEADKEIIRREEVSFRKWELDLQTKIGKLSDKELEVRLNALKANYE